MLFHAYPTVCRGGFAGVDVFFVISGFLITGIVARDLDRGQFSFRRFYAARVRRLFPALLLVLAAVLAYGCVVLLPAELARLGADTAAGAGFVANLWLWHEADYFDRTATAKPLLHLWSLGVEEQFYAAWPLLLWSLAKAGLRRPPVLLAAATASFALSLAWQADPAADFYAPLTRIWELAAGGWLALRGPAPDSRLGWAGALLLILAFAGLDRSLPYPSGLAALPVLATLALIAAGAGPITRTLSRPAFVGLGRISYPLYLWHWPLFSYAFILRRGRPPTPLMAAAFIAASLALAALTYAWVEKPLRFGPARRRNTRGLAIAMAAMLATGLATALADGFPGRFRPLPRLDVAALNAALGDGVFAPTRSMRITRQDGVVTARIGSGPVRLLLTGDSLLFQYGPRVQALADAGRLKGAVAFVAGPSCLPVPGLRRRLGFVDCAAMLPAVARLLAAEPVHTIVIGGFWPGYPGPSPVARDGKILGPSPAATDAFWRNLRDEIFRLEHSGHKLFLIGCAPFDAAFDPAHMLARSPFGVRVPASLGTPILRPPLAAKCAASEARLAAIAAATGARRLDPFAQICPPAPGCPPLADRTRPKYADDKHLRPFYVREQITFLDPLLTGAATKPRDATND